MQKTICSGAIDNGQSNLARTKANLFHSSKGKQETGVEKVPDGVKNAANPPPLLHLEMHPVSPQPSLSEMGPLGTRGIAFYDTVNVVL